MTQQLPDQMPDEPPVPPPSRPAALGWRAMGRWTWAQLTSMRTALGLLFLLALAAVPGSFIPQQSVSEIKVTDFAAAHPTLDKLYRPLGLYHVYTSAWFSAIYLLLFISLIGCLVPRVATYWRLVRARPPRIPAHMERLPVSAQIPVTDSDQVLHDAESWLRRSHYRVERREDGAGVGLSAERGYLRELGNLVFHFSMLVVLAGVAVNGLWGYKGTSTVVVGGGFSNTITQYDELHPGSLVNTGRLTPFTLLLKSFDVTFETGPVQTGAARSFDAVVEVNADGTTTTHDLRVNHPLDIDGTRVHLLGQGYAADITVRDGNGNVASSGPVLFQPLDSNYRSAGVIKVPDARPRQLAFEGYFLPTAVLTTLGPASAFPDALSPELILNAWSGAPSKETGVPQNVYTLDKTSLTQITRNGQIVNIGLKPGETYTLPDGQGTITFNGWTRWARIQVSRQPGLWITVGAIGVAVTGLCFSLFIRPRRLWIRVRRGADATMLAEVAGLDRADARTGLADDVRGLAAASGVEPATIDLQTRSWGTTSGVTDAGLRVESTKEEVGGEAR